MKIPAASAAAWVALLALGHAPRVNAEEVGWLNASETQRAFSDFEETCEKDGGKLWGASLCGPVMVVDPASRALLANRQPTSGSTETSVAMA